MQRGCQCDQKYTSLKSLGQNNVKGCDKIYLWPRICEALFMKFFIFLSKKKLIKSDLIFATGQWLSSTATALSNATNRAPSPLPSRWFLPSCRRLPRTCPWPPRSTLSRCSDWALETSSLSHRSRTRTTNSSNLKKKKMLNPWERWRRPNDYLQLAYKLKYWIVPLRNWHYPYSWNVWCLQSKKPWTIICLWWKKRATYTSSVALLTLYSSYLCYFPSTDVIFLYPK